MNGKRGVAASMLAGAGITGAINRLRPKFSGRLTILAYHRILDVDDEDQFPFDIELVSASTGAFREQMRLLRRHFNPITFATLLDYEDPKSWDPFEIRRIHIERYIDLDMFAATLALPGLFIPRSA